MIIILYYQVKTSISLLCRQCSNPESLIQLENRCSIDGHLLHRSK